MLPNRLSYESLWKEAEGLTTEEALHYFGEHLAYLCRDAYLQTNSRPADILRIRQGGFEYVFDNYTAFESSGEVAYSPAEESRLIVAYGRSSPRRRTRDDYRLRGWVGPTNMVFGAAWDKGHFIGHALGGAVDGVEANVFVQRRDLNRGWSPEGKLFRRMEKYGIENAGTFCFARPIYVDGTSRPGWLEFGVIKVGSGPWVECFSNQSETLPA